MTAITFSHDGTRLLTGDKNGRVTLWSGSDGRLIKRFEGIDGSVVAVDISANGQHAAAIGKSGRVWKVASGDTLLQTGGGTDIQLAPDGDAVIAAAGVKANVIELSTNDSSLSSNSHRAQVLRRVGTRLWAGLAARSLPPSAIASCSQIRMATPACSSLSRTIRTSLRLRGATRSDA